MTNETFLKRLDEGKTNHFIYRSENVEGMISVWELKGQMILTWEECPPGQQFDESTYTKDIRHTFSDKSALLEFLSKNALDIQRFEP